MTTAATAAALVLEGSALSTAQVAEVARGRRLIAVSPATQARLAASRAALEHAIGAGEVLYGVNTGFGSLSKQRIDGAQLREIQRNLILSHAAGVGEPLADDL